MDSGLGGRRGPSLFLGDQEAYEQYSSGRISVGVSFLPRYIIRLFGWARKYGIRVNLHLHTIPGSQNGTSYIFFVVTMVDHAFRLQPLRQARPNQFPQWDHGRRQCSALARLYSDLR